MNPCFWNIFSPTLAPCPNEGTHKRQPPLGNLTDDWWWCAEHAMRDEDESKHEPAAQAVPVEVRQ